MNPGTKRQAQLLHSRTCTNVRLFRRQLESHPESASNPRKENWQLAPASGVLRITAFFVQKKEKNSVHVFCLFQKWTNIVFTHFFTEKFSSTLLDFFFSKEQSRVSELPTFPTRDQPEFSICERTSGNRRPCPFCLVP